MHRCEHVKESALCCCCERMFVLPGPLVCTRVLPSNKRESCAERTVGVSYVLLQGLTSCSVQPLVCSGPRLDVHSAAGLQSTRCELTSSWLGESLSVQS